MLCLYLWIGLATASPCLQSGDETEINQALAKGVVSLRFLAGILVEYRTEANAVGGEGAVVSLCPGSVHRLNSTILFTAPRQTLTTLGDPAGLDRALLLIEGPDQATAVK